MKNQTKTRVFPAILVIVVLAGAGISTAQPASLTQAPTGDIRESEIVALQEELAEVSKASSSIRKRRACKNVIRDGEDLLEKNLKRFK